VKRARGSGGGRRMLTRRRMIALGSAVLTGLAIAPVTTLVNAATESGAGGAQVSERDLDALSKASVLYIATVRKDGNQSTAAPVWFTLAPDHSVLIQTAPTTWKAKRVRRGSPMIVWIGKLQGPAFVGKAEITENPAVSHQIVEDFPKRYLMARLGLHTPTQAMFDQGKILAIVITPVRDLRDGFKSQSGTPAPGLEHKQ